MSGALQISMEVKGLNALVLRMSKYWPVLEAELKRAEYAGLKVIRDDARKRATVFALDGRLPNSITFEQIRGGLEGIVGSLATTGSSIEQGTIPQLSVGHRAALLKSWVKRKGLAGTPRAVKTHRPVRTAAIRAAEVDLAWKIAMAQQGQATTRRGPLPFIIPAAAATSHQVSAIFNDAVHRALVKIGKGP